MKNELYGLVVCGGQSTRMGTDKSLIAYHRKPQRYHVYDMLEWVCDKVFISCNNTQASDIIAPYAILEDLPAFEDMGPMAALLTAFTTYPGHDFLVVGCDYPFITIRDLKEFIRSIQVDSVASAFYNKDHDLYEPLLAWYSHRAGREIQRMFDEGQYSLQQFLRGNQAEKYEPIRPKNITSVDTPEECQIAKAEIAYKSPI